MHTPNSQPLIIYARVSRVGERDEDKFWSPREQEQRAREHALAKGYTVGEVIVDLDQSGGTHPLDRPGMARAIEEIQAGRAGGITAYSIDRLSRDPVHGDWLVKAVTDAGGVVLAPDLPEDIASPSGEFTFSMLLSVARLYRRAAGARFESSKAEATRKGICISTIPFGYTKDDQRRMVVDPSTAPIVKGRARRSSV